MPPQVLLALAFLLVLCLAPNSLRAQDTDPSAVSQWSALQSWPIIAIHAHVLLSGKVLFHDGTDMLRIWDPATNAITSAAPAGFNIFCSGHAFLPHGRLLFAGRHITDYVGFRYATVYDPATNSWTRLPETNKGRWYPTVTALPNGDMPIVSGKIDTSVGYNRLPQVW